MKSTNGEMIQIESKTNCMVKRRVTKIARSPLLKPTQPINRLLCGQVQRYRQAFVQAVSQVNFFPCSPDTVE